jgi:hypothetical protein
VLQVYSKDNAAIPPCRFSSRMLEAALRAAPTYDVEYAGDLAAAIQTTLDAQASGACSRRHAHATGGPVPGLNPGRPPGLPRSATAPGGGAVPLPLLLALAAAVLGALGAALVATARRLGWEPLWADSARHAWSETEYRLAGTWADFRDWLRAS